MTCIDKIKFNKVIECIIENNNIPLNEKDLLPIFHVTELGKLDLILDDRKLEAVNPCEYCNNEHIVFLSYGKISYLPKSLIKDMDIITEDNLPIVFIFEPDVYKNMHFDRLVCFDSGALINGRFGISNRLDHYEILKPKKKDILASVWLLFGNNKEYLKNNIKMHENNNPLSFITKINKLFKDIHKPKIKTGLLQAATFELHKKGHFDLTATKMIVPEKSISKSPQETIKKYLDNNIEFITYTDTRIEGNENGVENHIILTELEKTIKNAKNKIYGYN